MAFLPFLVQIDFPAARRKKSLENIARLRIAAEDVRLIDSRKKIVMTARGRRAPINPLVILPKVRREAVAR